MNPPNPAPMPSPPARSAATIAPTPVEPVDGAVAPLDAVTFRWAAPPGPKAFDLRIASAADPEATLVELTGLPTTEATLADTLPAGPCLWWVRREGGAWSVPARFVAGTAADLEVASRQAAEQAARERVAEAETARAIPRGYEPIGEAPPEPVWPYASGEALTETPALDWSTIPGFGTPERTDEMSTAAAAPRVLGPIRGEVTDAAATSLRWTSIPGATHYDVELSPHAAFDRDVLTLHAGQTDEVALPGLLPATGHRLLWRVRGHTASGVTAWSKYGRFYPAADAAVDAFRQQMDAATLADRKRREHADRIRQREIDLIPLHQREDAVTGTATYAVVLGVGLAAAVTAALALTVHFLMF